ncbi:MAG: Meiotic Sister-Chromatid recombination aldehyde dehydrogenase [Vezdaea aestivalis]|nr:MAG: Meiotic Sister-Chromatid recombination aldehyde dehydrogenase [Vezdaea aestivalis]
MAFENMSGVRLEALWDTNLTLVAILTSLAAALVAWKLFQTPKEPGPISYFVQSPPECGPGWTGQILDDPSLKIHGSSAIRCYAPASGQLLGVVDAASPGSIDRAVAKARLAQESWRKTSFKQRRHVLRTLLSFLLKNQSEIATTACLDSGKTMVDASFGEILVTAEKLQWTIRHGEKALRKERRPTNDLLIYKHNEFHNLIGPMISSTFAGNGIIVKGSEATAWSSRYFIQIFQGALHACGHDPNLVQAITCWPSVAPSLTLHPEIGHITFIGSKQVALDVSAAASKRLVPLCLELGGKDAAIVLDDCRGFDKVASILMRGVFQSSGQNCIGIERIIACPLAYRKLVKILEPRVKALRVGNPLGEDAADVDVGALISGFALQKLEDMVQKAVKDGATLLAGGHRYVHPRYPKGHYFEPTLLVNVYASMEIAQCEAFGPLICLMEAENVDSAITMANSTAYGLGGSVFGTSRKDIDKVVSASKTGMISVNDFGTTYATQLP